MVSLGEGMTPLLHCPRLGKQLGLTKLFVKDESQLPTGSFKSRGMTTAVSLAWLLGRRGVTSVIIGPRTLGQLEENLPGFDLELAPDVVHRLNEVSRPPDRPRWRR